MTKHFTVEGETYELIESRLTFAETRAFEKVTGVMYQEMADSKSVLVVQGLLWLSMKRKNPALKFSDLDHLALDELDIESDDEPDVPDAPLVQDAEASAS